jgi:transcriptional regulator with GAF, ATPase, and Fis domain
MAQPYKNWLAGTDQPDEISAFAETYLQRLNADFFQLLLDPSSNGTFKVCYTYPGKTVFNYESALQHKYIVEKLITGRDITQLHESDVATLFPEDCLLRQLAYRQHTFLPVYAAEKRLGLFCIYSNNKITPNDVHLEAMAYELGSLLRKPEIKAEIFKGRSVALAVCRELAFVRNRKQLSDLLEIQIKNLLHYNYTTIFLLENETGRVVNIFENCHSLSAAYPFVDSVRLGKVPLEENILQQSFAVSRSETLNFEKFDENADLFPFLVKPRCQVENGFIFNLYGGEELIGKWVLSFTPGWEKRGPDNESLQLVSQQLILTIAHIIANEKVKKIEEEKQIIGALNADFSSTRDKNYLLNIIHVKLRKLFDFSHNIVSLINDDDTTCTSFLRDTNSRARNHPIYQRVAAAKYPLVDGILNRALLSQDPVIFDLQELRKKETIPEYMQMIYESGIRKVTVSTLQIRSKTIGFWLICHLENQEMSPRQVELMKNISAQFSIAIDNIRVNERITAKETETENLLKFSFNLTKIRSKNDLKKVLLQNLAELINFEEVVIMTVKNDIVYEHFLEMKKNGDDLSHHYSDAIVPSDTCLSMEANDTIIIDVASSYGKLENPLHMINEFERGIREKVIIKLLLENAVPAVFCIHLDKAGTYSEHALQLLKGISYQISFAINNILANEKIAKREAERDLLLSLSSHISAVRNSTDLLHAIKLHIKKPLGFTHTFIANVSNDRRTVQAFLLDPGSPAKKHPNYECTIGQAYPINDGILDQALASPEPLVVELNDPNGRQDLPGYLKINQEIGITYAIIVRLEIGKNVFGLWFMFYNPESTPELSGLNFIKGLSLQISAALNNILSNSKIAQREIEKTSLINFSNLIFSIRDKKVLGQTIGEELKNLFDVSGYLICSMSENKSYCIPYIYGMNANFEMSPKLKTGELPSGINNMLVNTVLSGGGLKTFEADKWEGPEQFSELLNTARINKLNYLSADVLRTASEVLGIIILWHRHPNFTDFQLNLWKGVAAQLATAMSNRVADEKISSQLEEIRTYKTILEEEKVYLQEEIDTVRNIFEIIGESEAMKRVYQLVNQVAGSDSTVLLSGETGTGKEVIARAIHNNSPRKSKLMIKVNCAALPANLIESELFGHERGSFTGATEKRLGKFELANGSTLFLDEIGEMPLELQVKLLRAIQEREIERIGGKSPVKIDVRIIAATNRDLNLEMAEGRFRSDLFYRLNIFPIHLPPLRQRSGDIPLLVMHFVNRFAKKGGKKIHSVSNKVIQELQQYTWPGNIRELEHVIERSILLTTGESLKQIDLPVTSQRGSQNIVPDEFIPHTIDENERLLILRTLKFCKGKINGRGGAAVILGVPPSTLNSKIKRLGITKEHIQTSELEEPNRVSLNQEAHKLLAKPKNISA